MPYIGISKELRRRKKKRTVGFGSRAGMLSITKKTTKKIKIPKLKPLKKKKKK